MNDPGDSTLGSKFRPNPAHRVSSSLKVPGGVKVSSPPRFRRISSSLNSNLFNKVYTKRGRSISTLTKTRKMGQMRINLQSKGSILRTTRKQFDPSTDLK